MSRGASRLALVLGLLVAASAPRVRAQSTTASLTGTVRTEGGAAAAGARVDAKSVATGTVRSDTCDGRGEYRLDGLETGAWSVEAASAEGFRSQVVEVRLRLQEVVRLDLVLGASLVESVEVSGAASLLDPTMTGSELRISPVMVHDVPTVGRSLTDLALLDSAVLPAEAADLYGENGSVFVINGQSGRANSFLVDGLDNNDRTSNTTLNSFFSPLAVRELVVNTHSFAPEFGRAAGGIFNIVTERGSNETLGAGFVQGSHASWNEPGQIVDSLPPGTSDQDTPSRIDAGVKIGGAFRPDRAFYFFAFEHQDLEDVVPYTGVTRDGVAGGWAIAPNRSDNLFFRTDVALGPSRQLMVRLSGDERIGHFLGVGGTKTPESGFEVQERDAQLATTYTSTAPDRIHEMRLLASRSRFDQQANSTRPGVERPSGTFGGNNLNSQLREEDRLQFVDNVLLHRGSHTLKMGVDVSRIHTSIATRFHPQGNFTYNTDARWEPGDGYVIGRPETKCIYATDPDQMPCPGEEGVDDDHDGQVDEDADRTTFPAVYQLILGEPQAELADTVAGLFAQDSWQVSPRLLLEYGVRYDVSTFELPASARVESTVPNGGAGVDWNNVAPRVGFTWAGSGGKLVVRGGAGMFYDKLVMGFPAVAAITSGTAIGLTFPEALAFEINETVVEQLGLQAVLPNIVFPEELILRFSTATELDTPYTNLFHLGASWQATPRGVIEIDAVRSLGYHIPLFKDLNPVVGTDPLGIPVHAYDHSVGSIAAIVTEGRSWYAGADLVWRWQSKDGWYRFSYTFAKALDQGPDPLKGGVYLPPTNDFADEKARADSDRRHRLVLSGGVPLAWLGLRLSGMVQYGSGVPVNVTTGTDDNLDGITSDRPPGVGRNSGERTPVDPVNAVREEAGLEAAGAPDEPALFQVDLRLAKPFRTGEGRIPSEVYLQVFNLTNRFNGAAVEGRATARSFGDPVAYAGPPRTVEVGLRLGF